MCLEVLFWGGGGGAFAQDGDGLSASVIEGLGLLILVIARTVVGARQCLDPVGGGGGVSDCSARCGSPGRVDEGLGGGADLGDCSRRCGSSASVVLWGGGGETVCSGRCGSSACAQGLFLGGGGVQRFSGRCWSSASVLRACGGGGGGGVQSLLRTVLVVRRSHCVLSACGEGGGVISVIAQDGVGRPPVS